MERSPRPAVFDFHGVCMTEMVTNNWDNLQNFEARPDDILIAAYPKADIYPYLQESALPGDGQ
uniref:Sulfotransferase n=1 Tax=Acanthochromis polyacanthus TaxID=80966 RepID=A0A3Q1EI44_9TELE